MVTAPRKKSQSDDGIGRLSGFNAFCGVLAHQFAERCRFPASSFAVSMRPPHGAGLKTRRQTMRVMVFGKATQDSEKGAPPTAEAFAAMDRFTEELAKAGV